MTDCLVKLVSIREGTALYIAIVISFFGIAINIKNVFFTFWLKRTRTRPINQLHSGYIVGNTIVFTVPFPTAMLYVNKVFVLLCIQREMLPVFLYVRTFFISIILVSDDKTLVSNIALNPASYSSYRETTVANEVLNQVLQLHFQSHF